MPNRLSLATLSLAAVLSALAGCRLPPTPHASAVSSVRTDSAPFPPMHGPNALWTIVSQQCIPDLRHNGSPAPCALLEHADRADGYALLKDIQGKSQYLLIPTVAIRGIEAPSLLDPAHAGTVAPNYFADAWAHRSLVSAALGRPLGDDELSLAINPVHARSQQQLHIHIDCLDASVRRALRRHLEPTGAAWMRIDSNGRVLNARRITMAQFSSTNLFELVADATPEAAADMGGETILVTGAGPDSSAAGMWIVAGNFDAPAGQRWAAEALQDHACRGAAN